MTLYNKLQASPFFIAGPCVMESYELMEQVATELNRIQQKTGATIVFKASFDKANRTSLNSFRGPGLEQGMDWLEKIKLKFQLPITTDIHETWQAEPVGKIVDIIQIPAFLCRQTDLLVAAAKTGKIINIKKAQFLTAADMLYPVEKVKASGNNQILLTERGSMMSPGNLVVDFRNIPKMQKIGYPVVMDCTHSAQEPSNGNITGGNRAYVQPLAMAAKAFGANAYFLEVHPDPDKGLSDAANMYPLNNLETLIHSLL